MRTANRALVLAAATVALALPAAPALAAGAPATGDNFGQHVATCAHEMSGFTGAHNPGMHHGAAGWDGQSCQ